MTRTLAEIVEDAAGTLDKLHHLMATSSHDYGRHPTDARLWALLVGWDCETDHQHDAEDDDCANGVAMSLLAQRHGWDRDEVARIRDERASIRNLIAAADGPLADESLTSALVVEFRAPR